jgi:hypothetical protein
MINEEIARIFERMAKVLAFKGEDRGSISHEYVVLGQAKPLAKEPC